jgi:hypothetical protein
MKKMQKCIKMGARRFIKNAKGDSIFHDNSNAKQYILETFLMCGIFSYLLRPTVSEQDLCNHSRLLLLDLEPAPHFYFSQTRLGVGKPWSGWVAIRSRWYYPFWKKPMEWRFFRPGKYTIRICCPCFASWLLYPAHQQTNRTEKRDNDRHNPIGIGSASYPSMM